MLFKDDLKILKEVVEDKIKICREVSARLSGFNFGGVLGERRKNKY
ncbi:hypothetical protein [Brevibacillus daliensis]|nr:hypothetical protein [Brevibacillus daliensis]